VNASLPSGHPFRADISVFKHSTSAHDSKLLLARLAPNGGLHVIERVVDDVFVASRLRGCVKEGFFRALADGSVGNCLLEKILGHENQSLSHTYPMPASTLAIISNTAVLSPKRPKNRKGVLARMSILPGIEPRKLSIIQPEHEPRLEKDEAVPRCTSPEIVHGGTSSTPSSAKVELKPETSTARAWSTQAGVAEIARSESDLPCSSDELFESLREILLKTLYTSNTALAYFTKSTLSRTRAAFRSSNATSISELAEFYRTRLLTSKKMDSKYRDTIPKIIDNIIPQESTEKSATNSLLNGSKKKPYRRKQLGKDGLFAGEEEFIRTWWLGLEGKKTEALRAQSREQATQSLIKGLRNRETQLQIVIILEILTLESSTEAEREGNVLPTALKRESDDDEPKTVLAKTPTKASKKRDLKPELDILVDRLCIYQTVSIAERSISDDIKIRNSEFGNEIRDKLRDFACNVILPFYLHKAPDLVKEISRKLGGPNISAKRPMNYARASSRTKPGAAIETQRRSIPRPTLERVLSEEQSSRQSPPPVLMRSATAPLGASCTRDSTEATQRPSSRGSLQKSRSFSNREVDLVASSKAQEAKRRKLANLAKQKDELSAAIHTLKKPNRSLVGIEIMAEVAKRSAEQGMARRGTLYRNSSSRALGVQITATPKKGETSCDTTGKRPKLGWDERRKSEDQARSLVEEPAVPSSSVREVNFRPSQVDRRPTDPSAAQRAIYSAIHETPSRGSSKTSNPLTLPPSTHSLNQLNSPTRRPLPANLSHVEATPSTNRLRPEHANLVKIENTPIRMTKSQRPVLFTPLRKAEVNVERVFRDAPLVSEMAAKAMERAVNGGGGGKEASIYDSLGWDDDVDELV
jgi:DNA replication regulator SLD3